MFSEYKVGVKATLHDSLEVLSARRCGSAIVNIDLTTSATSDVLGRANTISVRSRAPKACAKLDGVPRCSSTFTAHDGDGDLTHVRPP
jgi:hypothetical protein